MPTFLMVGKLTKHEPNDIEMHVPSRSMVRFLSFKLVEDLLIMLAPQGSALEIGVEQEVTITKDPVRPLSLAYF